MKDVHVVVANALGFYPFNIKIINRSNHAVVAKNSEEATEEGITAKFYRISYVPEGYEQEDEYDDGSANYLLEKGDTY